MRNIEPSPLDSNQLSCSPIRHSRFKRSLALYITAFLLIFSGTAHACLATCVELTIQNDIDSNGHVSVVSGSKVIVDWAVLQNDDKVLKPYDRIELLRTRDDKVVSSAERGKGKSGSVKLKVKHSVGEELYVRYRAKKDGSIPATVPDRMNPDYFPLTVIAKSSTTDLTVRINALETAPTSVHAVTYSGFYEDGVGPTASQCANWTRFRQNLRPDDYSCVQLSGSHGRGVTSCDIQYVSSLARALQDGVVSSYHLAIGSSEEVTWETYNANSGDWVWIGARPGPGGIALSGCAKSANVAVFRPCMTSTVDDWGDVSGSTNSCGQATSIPRASAQTISLTFR